MGPAASGPLIFGAQLDARMHPAHFLRLSPWRYRAYVRRALAMFVPLQVGRGHIASSSTWPPPRNKLAAQDAGTIG